MGSGPVGGWTLGSSKLQSRRTVTGVGYDGTQNRLGFYLAVYVGPLCIHLLK